MIDPYANLEDDAQAFRPEDVTNAHRAVYWALTDRFIYVIELCDELVTRYDEYSSVKARVDAVENALRYPLFKDGKYVG